MSEIDESDLSVADVLPTGTVTLLLADVEGWTRLWQTVPDEMAAAIVQLDDVLSRGVPQAPRCATCRAGRRRQLCTGLLARHRRRRVRFGLTARAAGADKSAHRGAHR